MGATYLERSYSFEEAVKDSIMAEATSAHLDLGPVDTMDPAALELAYDEFYGTSPLNSPSPSPSRPTSPHTEAQGQLGGELFEILPHGASSPPPSPPSRLAESHPVIQPLPHQTPLLSPQSVQPNSKTRRNRTKGKEKRRIKRKAERDGQDANATPHPRSLKRVKKADSTQTSYQPVLSVLCIKPWKLPHNNQISTAATAQGPGQLPHSPS